MEAKADKIELENKVANLFKFEFGFS